MENRGCVYCKLTPDGRKEIKSEKGIVSDVQINEMSNFIPKKCYGIVMRILDIASYDTIKINYCPMCGTKL